MMTLWQLNTRGPLGGKASDPLPNDNSGGKEKLAKVVLVIEDNAADVFLLEEAFREYGLNVKLLVMDDGEKAVQWIKDANGTEGTEAPQVVVLDLNLPKRTGAEVLEQLRSSERFHDLPVIIFTSSNSYQDRSLASRFPATRFFQKSPDFDEFIRIGKVVKEVIDGTETN